MNPPLIAAGGPGLVRLSIRREIPRHNILLTILRKRHIKPGIKERVDLTSLIRPGPGKGQRYVVPLLHLARHDHRPPAPIDFGDAAADGKKGNHQCEGYSTPFHAKAPYRTNHSLFAHMV